MKEEMSSFDIAVVAAELDRMVSGFRVNNIYQLNPRTLLLNLRGHEGSHKHIILEAGERVHATSYVLEKPLKPPGFCMALRKHLRNGTLEKIQQHGFERIVEMRVTGAGGEYRLVAELFGEGNIILVDQENGILQALSYRRMKDRNILRGEVFGYPPPRGQDPRKLARKDFEQIGTLGQIEVVKAIAGFLGIGGLYAEELLLRAGVAKSNPCSSLGDGDLDAIFSSLQGLLSEIAVDNVRPCVYVDEDGDWVDVAPVQLKKYAHLKHLQFQTFNEALDEYYAKVSVEERTSDVKESAEQEVARLERILLNQEETLRDSARKAEAYRKVGDAIYLHLNELQLLTQSVMGDKRGGISWSEIVEALEKEKRESVIPAIYFQALKPKALVLQVSVEGQVFDLDLRLPAQKNAAEYYNKAKKAAKKVKGVQKAIEETRKRIEQTKLQVTEKVEKTAQPLRRKRREEWYEKFRWFHSSEGFLVIGGRDASTNEVLIKKHTESQDMAFHAELSGAPFVIVKTGGRKPPEQTVKEAAQFAGSYSRAWKESLGAVDVYWVSPDQVSKTPPSGEYLPRGSFMVYGAKNYVRGAMLEVAIGVRKEGEELRVIGGPPTAIAKQNRLYVRLVPGRISSGDLAKQIKSRLAQLASDEERGLVLKIPLEEVQRFIPSGRGAIM